MSEELCLPSVDRLIRFNLALSIVQDVYSEYCRDTKTTRSQVADFCDFVLTMQCFKHILESEIRNK